MKIAIDISQVVYEGTGVATYTREIVRLLLTIDKENEYVLFGMSFRRNHILWQYFHTVKDLHPKVEAKFFRFPQSFENIIWNGLHKFPFVETLIGNIDVFHSSDWIQPPTRAKKVTTIHDLVVYKFPQSSHPTILETQKRRLHWVKEECDKIICDSAATHDDIVEILGIESQRLEVVYPGVEERFKPASKKDMEAKRRKYGLGEDGYILVVGTIEPRKNIPMVLKAFEALSQHALMTSLKAPLALAVVGKTGWGQKIQLAQSAKLLGFVPNEDLAALYSGAICFVYPSLYEGFGLPILEAMACGCPVVTSDRGSLKEIAADAAVFVDPLDPSDIARKIVQVVVDRTLQLELRKKGKKNAEKYTWEKTAREVLGIYESIVQ